MIQKNITYTFVTLLSQRYHMDLKDKIIQKIKD